MSREPSRVHVLHYFGAEAIAKRLACHPLTLYRWRTDYGLPMFVRRHNNRRVLYASEAMLAAWELARAQTQAAARKADSRAKAGR